MNEFHRRSRTHRTTSPFQARDAYAVTFRDTLTRMLRRTAITCDIDDIVSREVVSLWSDIDAKMGKFPNPSVYAFVRAQGDRALIGFRRNEQVQRGEGARGGRTVVSIHQQAQRSGEKCDDASDLADTLFDHTSPFANGLDVVADRLGGDQMLFAALMQLTERQRTLLYLVDGHGYSVTAAADALGVARETASRDRHAAYRAMGTTPPC